MSRTRASATRKSKSRTGSPKRPVRKSAVKRTGGTRRSAAGTTHRGRAKSVPKSPRHGIRKPVKVKAKPRVVKVVKKAVSRVRKSPPANVKKTNDQIKMKRTTTEKTKTGVEKSAKKVQPTHVAGAIKPAAVAAEAVAVPKVKTPKAAAKSTAPKVELPPVVPEPEPAPAPTTGRRKSRAEREHRETVAASRERAKPTRARGTKIPGFDDELMQDYVMDEEVEEEELPDEMALDPLELPLELLDPELVEVPRPAAPPKPKQKVSTVNRRQQACANCGNTYSWLSVEQLCFSCLKKKLAQRKREDESFTGYASEPEEEEDAS